MALAHHDTAGRDQRRSREAEFVGTQQSANHNVATGAEAVVWESPTLQVVIRDGKPFARVVEGRTLYVNTTDQQKRIPVSGRKKGIVSGREWDGAVVLGALEADLVE